MAEENDRLKDQKNVLEERLKLSVLEKERKLQSTAEVEEELRKARTQLAIGQFNWETYSNDLTAEMEAIP